MSRRPHYPWQLPAAMERRLGADSYGAQRIIHEEGQLLLILHEPPAAAAQPAGTPSGAVRRHAVFLRQADGRWLHEGREGGERVLIKLLDSYAAALTALEKQHAQADSSTALFAVLGPLIPLSRAAGNLQLALQAARQAEPDDALLIDQRDRAVDLARGLELLLADTRMVLDYRLAAAAEEQARATFAVTRAQHKLNTIAALTFPLMAIGAAFGMNLRSGAEDAPGWVFWALFAAGVSLGLLLRGWVAGAPQAPASPIAPKRAGPSAKKPTS